MAGEIIPGDADDIGQTHVAPPVVNNATHSHYGFNEVSITCADDPDLTLGVQARGGNDGHVIDEGDCVTGDHNNVTTTVEVNTPPACDLPGSGPLPHAFNLHHGSTNDSGWSHSSGYEGGDSATNDEEDPSNDCPQPGTDPAIARADDVDNRNKGEIEAGGSSGWVKYLRTGTVIYAWGCFLNGPLGPDADTSAGEPGNPVFSAGLAISPPSPNNVEELPFCLVSKQILDLGQEETCGFTIAGVAHRSPVWLQDLG